jgi:hypothetical protein
MFTYPTLLISYVYTVPDTIYCILSMPFCTIMSHPDRRELFLGLVRVLFGWAFYVFVYHTTPVTHHSFIYFYVHILHPFTFVFIR